MLSTPRRSTASLTLLFALLCLLVTAVSAHAQAPAPAAPTFAQLQDNTRLNQPSPAIRLAGVDPTASQVTLYEVDESGNSVPIGSTDTVTPDGTATVTPTAPLADGDHGLLLTQTVGGTETDYNDMAQSQVNVVVLHAAPSLDWPQDGTLTSDQRPSFDVSGALSNLEQNHTLAVLYVDGQPVGQSEGDGAGATGIQPDAPVADGQHSAYVVTVDDLDHVSDVHSNVVHFTVDTTAPAMPTVTSPAAGETVSSATPAIAITSEPGSAVTLYVDDAGEQLEGIAGSDGKLTLTPTRALTAGAHVLHLYATDAAGNAGDLRDSPFTVAGAPAAPAAAPVETPAAPPAATPPAPLAAKIASIKGVRLSSKTLTVKRPVKVRFTVTRPTTVTVTLTRAAPRAKRAKKGARLPKPASTKTVTVTKPGPATITITRTKRVPKGNYLLQLKAKKAAKPVTVPLTVG